MLGLVWRFERMHCTPYFPYFSLLTLSVKLILKKFNSNNILMLTSNVIMKIGEHGISRVVDT